MSIGCVFFSCTTKKNFINYFLMLSFIGSIVDDGSFTCDRDERRGNGQQLNFKRLDLAGMDERKQCLS